MAGLAFNLKMLINGNTNYQLTQLVLNTVRRRYIDIRYKKKGFTDQSNTRSIACSCNSHHTLDTNKSRERHILGARKSQNQKQLKVYSSCDLLQKTSRGFSVHTNDSVGGTVTATGPDTDIESSQYSDANSTKGKPRHIPVMLDEVLDALNPKNGQVILDMTFGAGGHASEILKRAPRVKYLAADRDPLAHTLACDMAARYNNAEGTEVVPILSRFSELPHQLMQCGVQPGSVDAVLMDLGVSSMQFDIGGRGFAISKDGPLDMRMDGSRFPDMATAADVVNHLDMTDLEQIFRKYGEEKRAMHIAQALVEARYAYGNFTRTSQLAKVISTVFDAGAFTHDRKFRHSHVATKAFMALRIFVNNELNEVHNGLEVAKHFLREGGPCVVLSFHSLEDRIVKRQFHTIDVDEEKNLSIQHYRNSNVFIPLNTIQEDYLTRAWKPVKRKMLEPLENETIANPRSRSAKLRVGIRTDEFD